jgi:Zn finger protein HypA/HybF involved in hydrogenase expression
VHELSLAVEVCRIVEETVGAGRLPAVVEVGVEVGDRSGIEASSLEFCLEAILAAPPFRSAHPVVERVPGMDMRVTWLEVEDDSPPD